MRRVRAPSAEFWLLSSCCAWNFATASSPENPELPPGIDWNHFAALAQYHRVQGLAWKALAKCAEHIPADVANTLASDARNIAATNLATAGECGALNEAFAASKTPLLFLKGLAVAALVYRSPMLKMAWDIDILVDPRDLECAAQILSGRGFQLRVPARLTDLGTWHARHKESVWSRSDGLHVELHTGLADHAALIPTLDVHALAQEVKVTDRVVLRTLADDELFAYLAVHGASSAWFRLKWISEFAALVSRDHPSEIDALYRNSQQLGAGRAAGQALLLADRLFGTLEAAPSLRAQLGRDAATRRLERASLRLLLSGPSEPTDRLFGTLPIHLTQFDLLPGLGYKLSELTRQVQRLFVRQS